MYSVDQAIDSFERLDLLQLDGAWLRCNAVLPHAKTGTVNGTINDIAKTC